VIRVNGVGRVWIDGEEKGSAPGEFKASIGRHVVWLTGPQREPRGKEVDVTAERPGVAAILDIPLTRPQRVIRLRMQVSTAPDAAARAIAMKQLAEFVNVHDAVLLSSEGGAIVWQTWRDRAPGFSAPQELGRDNPLEILKQLAPPPPVVEPEPVVQVPLTVARWYQRRPVQVGLALTVVAAVVSGYMWAHYSEPPRSWRTDIKVLSRSP
jgi:hypothetical protein